MNIIIVNEQDQEIGVKERNSILLSDIYRVSALWITNSHGDILLAQRSLMKKQGPGMWGPAVAGTVEKGETYSDNILKETKEEIGLSVSIHDLVSGPKLSHLDSLHPHFTQYYLYCIDQQKEEFVIQESEVAQIDWFTREELAQALETRPHEFLPAVSRLFSLLSQ